MGLESIRITTVQVEETTRNELEQIKRKHKNLRNFDSVIKKLISDSNKLEKLIKSGRKGTAVSIKNSKDRIDGKQRTKTDTRTKPGAKKSRATKK